MEGRLHPRAPMSKARLGRRRQVPPLWIWWRGSGRAVGCGAVFHRLSPLPSASVSRLLFSCSGIRLLSPCSCRPPPFHHAHGPSQTPLAPSCLLALPSSSVLHGDRGQGTGTQTLHGPPQLQNPQWLLCTGEEDTTHPGMLYFSDKSANFNTPRATGRRNCAQRWDSGRQGGSSGTIIASAVSLADSILCAARNTLN